MISQSVITRVRAASEIYRNPGQFDSQGSTWAECSRREGYTDWSQCLWGSMQAQVLRHCCSSLVRHLPGSRNTRTCKEGQSWHIVRAHSGRRICIQHLMYLGQIHDSGTDAAILPRLAIGGPAHGQRVQTQGHIALNLQRWPVSCDCSTSSDTICRRSQPGRPDPRSNGAKDCASIAYRAPRLWHARVTSAAFVRRPSAFPRPQYRFLREYLSPWPCTQHHSRT